MIGAMYSGKNIKSYGKKKFLVSFQLIVKYRITLIMLVETDIISKQAEMLTTLILTEFLQTAWP
jgi:hypothetical protein